MTYRRPLVASVIALAFVSQLRLPVVSDAATGAGVAAPRCALTPIRTTPFHVRDLAPLPWVEANPVSAGITGHLFYAYGLQGRAAALHTHGTMPDGRSTKILWVIEHARADRVLTIEGRNLAGSGTLHQLVPRALSPATDYPSIVDVPAPGCWLLRLTSGTVRGTVTVRVIG